MKRKGDSKGFMVRALQMRRVVEQHYEPGRQDRCLRWVWQREIWPVWGVEYRTFLFHIKKAGWRKPSTE